MLQNFYNENQTKEVFQSENFGTLTDKTVKLCLSIRLYLDGRSSPLSTNSGKELFFLNIKTFQFNSR